MTPLDAENFSKSKNDALQNPFINDITFSYKMKICKRGRIIPFQNGSDESMINLPKKPSQMKRLEHNINHIISYNIPIRVKKRM